MASGLIANWSNLKHEYQVDPAARNKSALSRHVFASWKRLPRPKAGYYQL
jgi:hypothetical protein